MKHYLCVLFFCLSATAGNAGFINASSYAFSASNGQALENMATGTTQLIGPGADGGGTGALQSFGFDFWYAGQRYTQYDASEKGFIRLGGLVLTPGEAGEYSNLLSSTRQPPCITPYWDQIRVGSNGKVHCKITGTAPNRKLVVEWLNMQVPRGTAGSTGAATFQLWLNETSGNIEFVYGSGMVPNGLNSGYSVGFNLTSADYVTVNVGSSTVAYSTTPQETNTTGIPAGLKYSFTSSVPEGPTNLVFNNVTGTSMELNWTMATSNFSRYVVYRSDDGGLTYKYNFSQAFSSSGTTIFYTDRYLVPGTTYMWRVYATSFESGALSTPITGTQATLSGGNITSNGTGGGNWSNAATWSTGSVPGNADNVTIKDGDLVTIDVADSVYNVTIGEGISGNLQFEETTGRTLTILNNMEIKPGAVLNTTATGVVTSHVLIVNHDLINNGTLDLARATNGASLRFGGIDNSTFTGTGAVTDIYKIGPFKSSIVQITELNLTNFSVGGISSGATSGLLSGSAGTLKISGSNAFNGTLTSSAPFSLPATFQLWINNPNFTITGQAGDMTLLGTLKISQGTFNVGSAINNTLFLSGVSSKLIMEGGTLNIAGKCSTAAAVTYEQSGGTVNVCTIGNNSSQSSFEFSSTGSVFKMSGGLMVLQQINSNVTPASRRDMYIFPTTFVTSGGTLQVGSALTTGNSGDFTYRIYGSMPATVIDNTTNPKSILALAGLNSQGAVLINPSCSINLNGNIWQIFNGPVTNNGSVTGTLTGSRIRINTGNPVTYGGTGTDTVVNLEISNAGGLVMSPSKVNNLVVTNAFFMMAGGVTNANKLTFGTGGSSSFLVQMGNINGGASTAAGSLDVPPVFNIGSAGQTINYGRTTTARPTGPEINPTRSIVNMTMENLLPITLTGGNLQVTGTFTINLGNIDLNGDTLTMGSSATLPGTFSLISTTSIFYNGKFRRWTNTGGGSKQFPVGIATTRRNLSISPTITTGGTLTAEYITTPGGNNGLPLVEGSLPVNSTVNVGYWRVTPGNGLVVSGYTTQLTATSITGVTDFTKLVLVKRTDAASPWTLHGTHGPTGGTNTSPILQRLAMTSFGDYAIGSPAVSAPLTTTWTGNLNTAWEDAGNWSDGVPGITTAVTIPAAMPRYPIINTNTSIKSLSAAPGASVTVAIGVNVTITN
ncbi:MAG: fibronectin type III domain-containing protein [Bacteroidota bacterium]